MVEDEIKYHYPLPPLKYTNIQKKGLEKSYCTLKIIF